MAETTAYIVLTATDLIAVIVLAYMGIRWLIRCRGIYKYMKKMGYEEFKGWRKFNNDTHEYDYVNFDQANFDYRFYTGKKLLF